MCLLSKEKRALWGETEGVDNQSPKNEDSQEGGRLGCMGVIHKRGRAKDFWQVVLERSCVIIKQSLGFMCHWHGLLIWSTDWIQMVWQYLRGVLPTQAPIHPWNGSPPSPNSCHNSLRPHKIRIGCPLEYMGVCCRGCSRRGKLWKTWPPFEATSLSLPFSQVRFRNPRLHLWMYVWNGLISENERLSHTFAEVL